MLGNVKISFIVTEDARVLLRELQDSLAVERAKPFSNDSQMYNYLLQLGIVRFLEGQNEVD